MKLSDEWRVGPDLRAGFAHGPCRECEREANRVVADLRHRYGFARRLAPLLSDPDANPKLAKDTGGAVDAIVSLSLSPAGHLTELNLCPYSTRECRRHCVAHTGRATFDPRIDRARAWKAQLLHENPYAFGVRLAHELRLASGRLAGLNWALRPNAFSDVRWEVILPDLLDVPPAGAYDYTKRPDRVPHPRYHLTRSATERTTEADIVASPREQQWAVVFRGPLPDSYAGRLVVDGDVHDYRPANPSTVIVGLKAKGQLARNDSRFAVTTTT